MTNVLTTKQVANRLKISGFKLRRILRALPKSAKTTHSPRQRYTLTPRVVARIQKQLAA